MSKTYQGRCCSCFPQNSSTSFRAATSNIHKHQFIYYIFCQIAAATSDTAESDLSENICSNQSPSILRLVSFFDRYEGNKCQLLWSGTGEAWDKKILIQSIQAWAPSHAHTNSNFLMDDTELCTTAANLIKRHNFIRKDGIFHEVIEPTWQHSKLHFQAWAFYHSTLWQVHHQNHLPQSQLW